MTATRRPPRMHARVHQRRQAVAAARRRRRRRRAGAVAGLVALVVGAVVLVRSPLFEIERVEVRGASGQHAEQVHQRLQPAVGTPLVSVDRRTRSAEVVALPWVRDVSLHRRPPDTLLARVQPREPIALIQGGGGAWQVDADGVVVATGADAGSGELVTIHAGQAALAPPGEPLRDDTLREAVDVVAALPDDLAPTVDAVDASRPRALALHLDGGAAARLGSAERLPAKLDALRLVLEDLAAREGESLAGIAVIDVRVPKSPTVRRATDDPG